MSLPDPPRTNTIPPEASSPGAIPRRQGAAGAAFAAALDGRLAVARDWLSGLRDPELGLIGPGLAQKFRRAAAREEAYEGLTANAVYGSFAWPPKPGQRGFQNVISYGAIALQDMGKLFGARVHEYIHALQYRHAAALYADPFNDASPFVLSPQSYVLRKERLEQDAYAKGAWLQSLLPPENAAARAALDATPLGVDEFVKLRAQHGSLAAALAAAARQASDCEGYWLNGSEKSPARDLWHNVALREYRAIMQARAKKGLAPPVFVTLSAEGIAAIGDNVGPNPFRVDASLCGGPLQLSAANAALLQEIERECNVPDQASLPTLREALQGAGLSPADFICRSRRHRGPAA